MKTHNQEQACVTDEQIGSWFREKPNASAGVLAGVRFLTKPATKMRLCNDVVDDPSVYIR